MVVELSESSWKIWFSRNLVFFARYGFEGQPNLVQDKFSSPFLTTEWGIIDRSEQF